jgi:peroxiredoxin
MLLIAQTVPIVAVKHRRCQAAQARNSGLYLTRRSAIIRNLRHPIARPSEDVHMALTQSTMLPLGTKAPAFKLPDVMSEKTIELSSFAGKKALLVMFICRHCPYVKHVEHELVKLGVDYNNHHDIGIVAISSNDAENYKDDAPESLKEFALQLKLNYPLCYDETQKVAHAYTAACTPDFFLFDKEQRLVYRGQLDSSRPGNDKPVNGKDLRSAIDAVLNDKPVSPDQAPSAGCNIKWKAGNEPKY